MFYLLQMQKIIKKTGNYFDEFISWLSLPLKK